ncbi:MAG: hypothetical protein GF311_24785 [Candidatus Lokiarchaeota archaeon]|nr:hypothetical protein [Candidatus Lokiarchaeota archaeon]
MDRGHAYRRGYMPLSRPSVVGPTRGDLCMSTNVQISSNGNCAFSSILAISSALFMCFFGTFAMIKI